MSASSHDIGQGKGTREETSVDYSAFRRYTRRSGTASFDCNSDSDFRDAWPALISHDLHIHSQLYRLPLLGKGDLDSLSTRLLLPPLRDGDRLSRRMALRGGVTERDIDLVRLRPLCLSLPFLLGGVLDMDRDLGGGLARVARPILARESDLDLIDLDLERERPKLDRVLERLGRLNLGRDM
jgi:hypothetical protein